MTLFRNTEKTDSTYLVFPPSTLLLLITSLGCSKKKSSPDQLEGGWKNEAVCEILQDNANLTAVNCTFHPDIGHERHYHEIHFGYAISRSRFKIKDTPVIGEVDVPTGSRFSNDGIAWHEILNVGNSTAIFLIIAPK